MSQDDFDLSALPEAQRQKWQARLAQLPPGIRASLARSLGQLPPERVADMLERSAPMLDKVLARFGDQPQSGSSTPTASPPLVAKPSAGHYNGTVQRGDRAGIPLFPILVIVVGLALLLAYLLRNGGS